VVDKFTRRRDVIMQLQGEKNYCRPIHFYCVVDPTIIPNPSADHVHMRWWRWRWWFCFSSHAMSLPSLGCTVTVTYCSGKRRRVSSTGALNVPLWNPGKLWWYRQAG